MKHELKSWPEFFEPMLAGKKKFEYRFDDRRFNVGDVLHLREWKPGSRWAGLRDDGEYTGRTHDVTVTYLLLIGPPIGQTYYAIMSVEPGAPAEAGVSRPFFDAQGGPPGECECNRGQNRRCAQNLAGHPCDIPIMGARS